MINKAICIFSLAFLFGCSSETSKKEKIGSMLKEISFSKLDIPKQWIEITDNKDNFVYSIPCKNNRELFAVDLTEIDGQDALLCNFGTESQWYAIRNIVLQGDSFNFKTVLPFDTSQAVTFSMKYMNKQKNIVKWTGEGLNYAFIPKQDTIKYKRSIQPCNSIN
ncbi:hypothetical protein AHMF7605_12300 [Adhaeribacter arboris]|uniref:Lipoprotein n=1 Tax=Adhaeribacter arboris TaxID=2072846 RepID=A0A2T2YFF8_9BACT|nr:hypothetical protein [Adhaeribacter arboris]PSR54249.1 hypothetical protein AHMF7605_12300 [Adhaeribacter arboris]